MVEEQGGQWSVEPLGAELKALSQKTRRTKYRDTMKLLRLALSGLQVHTHHAAPSSRRSAGTHTHTLEVEQIPCEVVLYALPLSLIPPSPLPPSITLFISSLSALLSKSYPLSTPSLSPQQGPSVAEMMVCLGPSEVTHRFQKLLQLSQTQTQ